MIIKVGLCAMSDDLKNKSVGSLLRQARLAQKGKLPEISENLRINHEHLKALEEGNANGLPGLAYAVGFIRSYADHLGLDAESLIAQYKSQSSGISNGLDFPVTEDDYELPSFIIVSGLLVVSTIAYLFWAFLIDAEEIVIDKTNSISAYEETSEVDEASAIFDDRALDRPQMNDEALSDETTAIMSQKSLQKDTVIEGKGDTAGEKVVISDTVLDMKPMPDIAGSPLRGLGQTWLRISNGTGKVLYSSIILQGETFQLPLDGVIQIDTFDAGKLEYFYEDKVGPRLGKDGENLRGKTISVKSILDSIQ